MLTRVASVCGANSGSMHSSQYSRCVGSIQCPESRASVLPYPWMLYQCRYSAPSSVSLNNV